MNERYYTISQLNAYLKAKFETDRELSKIFLQAEISNFTRHSSGHLYFSLKDNTSQVKAVMFLTAAKTLSFLPKEGDKVLIEGRVSVYEASGTYQVYVQKMTLDGIGDLYLKYEQLKTKLQDLGWFDASRKRPIPKYPRAIGVLTSPTGAAIRDIIHIIERRYPLTKLFLYPTLVQGNDAKFSIKDQIEKANQDRFVDVLIVGRGGGSIEDLWAFNEEIVIKAIFDSKIPVVSAIGHETDFTIADFVSDLRAPTPSGAAEIVVPDRLELMSQIGQMKRLLSLSLKKIVDGQKKRLKPFVEHRFFVDPSRILERNIMTFDYLSERLERSRPERLLIDQKERLLRANSQLQKNSNTRFIQSVQQLRMLYTHLEALNPLKVLSQGYSVVLRENEIITSVQSTQVGMNLSIQFQDGRVDAQVTAIRKEKNNES